MHIRIWLNLSGRQDDHEKKSNLLRYVYLLEISNLIDPAQKHLSFQLPLHFRRQISLLLYSVIAGPESYASVIIVILPL